MSRRALANQYGINPKPLPNGRSASGDWPTHSQSTSRSRSCYRGSEQHRRIRCVRRLASRLLEGGMSEESPADRLFGPHKRGLRAVPGCPLSRRSTSSILPFSPPSAKSKSVTWQPYASWRMARTCCCSVRRARTKPIWRSVLSVSAARPRLPTALSASVEFADPAPGFVR